MIDKDIVLIEWVDSKRMERWEYFDEIEPLPPCVCYSVGFLIRNYILDKGRRSSGRIGTWGEGLC